MRLGILIKKFGRDDRSKLLISNLNKLKHLDITVFYNEHDIIPELPLFAIMQHEYLWGFKGPVVATDIFTASCLIKAPGPTYKYLYIWDYEWITSGMSYESLQGVYQSNTISLITRNDTQFKVVEKCWKKPVTIIEDFNHEQLARIAD